MIPSRRAAHDASVPRLFALSPSASSHEETHGSERLPQPGLRPSFLLERSHGSTLTARARRVRACDELAGRDHGASLGTKPIPASSGLFAIARSSHGEGVVVCVGGQTSRDANPAKGPAKSARRMRGHASLER